MPNTHEPSILEPMPGAKATPLKVARLACVYGLATVTCGPSFPAEQSPPPTATGEVDTNGSTAPGSTTSASETSDPEPADLNRFDIPPLSPCDDVLITLHATPVCSKPQDDAMSVCIAPSEGAFDCWTLGEAEDLLELLQTCSVDLPLDDCVLTHATEVICGPVEKEAAGWLTRCCYDLQVPAPSPWAPNRISGDPTSPLCEPPP